MTDGAKGWIEDELAGCRFVDRRLERRLHALLGRMADAMGESLPLVCGDWANTKAAYRFFANDRVGEGDILSGHFEATRRRVPAARGSILVLQDNTEFSYERENADQVGQTCRTNSGRDKEGRIRVHTVRRLLMHASLAVTTQGLPLGLGAVKFWTRNKFKGTNALKKRINPTRVPIDGKESVLGSTTCGGPPSCSATRHDASTSATGKTTSTSSSALRGTSGRISWSEPASAGSRTMAARPSPA
jgi:hypothetical protein